MNYIDIFNYLCCISTQQPSQDWGHLVTHSNEKIGPISNTTDLWHENANSYKFTTETHCSNEIDAKTLI